MRVTKLLFHSSKYVVGYNDRVEEEKVTIHKKTYYKKQFINAKDIKNKNMLMDFVSDELTPHDHRWTGDYIKREKSFFITYRESEYNYLIKWTTDKKFINQYEINEIIPIKTLPLLYHCFNTTILEDTEYKKKQSFKEKNDRPSLHHTFTMYYSPYDRCPDSYNNKSYPDLYNLTLIGQTKVNWSKIIMNSGESFYVREPIERLYKRWQKALNSVQFLEEKKKKNKGDKYHDKIGFQFTHSQ